MTQFFRHVVNLAAPERSDLRPMIMGPEIALRELSASGIRRRDVARL